MKTTIPCPQCRKPTDISEKTPFRPFCSERCRLIDLGAWASEEYQVDGQTQSEQLGDLDVGSDEKSDWDLPNLH